MLTPMLTLTLLLAFASRAEATVVKAMTLAEETETCPVVIHGIIERVTPRWIIVGARVETLVEVRILEVIKGEMRPKSSVVVRSPGGRIESFEEVVTGASSYREGDEAVLFLEPLEDAFVTVGVGIGKYDVVRDGGVARIGRRSDVATVSVDPTTGKTRVESVPPMSPEPLEQFLSRVKTIAKRTRPARAR